MQQSFLIKITSLAKISPKSVAKPKAFLGKPRLLKNHNLTDNIKKYLKSQRPLSNFIPIHNKHIKTQRIQKLRSKTMSGFFQKQNQNSKQSTIRISQKSKRHCQSKIDMTKSCRYQRQVGTLKQENNSQYVRKAKVSIKSILFPHEGSKKMTYDQFKNGREWKIHSKGSFVQRYRKKPQCFSIKKDQIISPKFTHLQKYNNLSLADILERQTKILNQTLILQKLTNQDISIKGVTQCSEQNQKIYNLQGW